MQNSPGPNRLLTYVILLATLLFGIGGSIFMDSTGDQENNQYSSNGQVLAEQDLGAVDLCDLLGLETGVIDSQPSIGSAYYAQDLGVITTVVSAANDESVSQIVSEINDSPAKSIHAVRLAYFERLGTNDMNEIARLTADKIAAIREQTADNSPPVHIMIANEPRTELGKVVGETNVSGDARTGGQWVANIVQYLKDKGGVAAETSDYLMYPAFNFHVPNGPGTQEYIDTFIQASIDGGVDLNNDFVSFGVSLQKQSGLPPMSDRIQMYRDKIEGFGVTGYKISHYAAAVVGPEVADESYVESINQVLETHGDVLDGIHIFSPWGWSAGGTTVYNEPIPIDIWDQLFESCSTLAFGPLQCKLPHIDEYPGLSSCTKVGDTGLNANLQLYNTESNGEEVWFSIPVVTTKVSNFGLLEWLTNSNHYDDFLAWMQENSSSEGFPYTCFGTEENPYKAPCSIDRQLTHEDVDVTQKFAGTIRYVDQEGDFSDISNLKDVAYSMPNLGNAIACMIYRADDYINSESFLQLEPRFKAETDTSTDLSSYNELSTECQTPLEIDMRRYNDEDQHCSGLVNRLDDTDEMDGPEIVEFENSGRTQFIWTRETICSQIAGGAIEVGGIGYQLCPYPYTEEDYIEDPSLEQYRNKANPEAVMVGNLPPGSFFRFNWPAAEDFEISGGAEALAEMWKEETNRFPWSGFYKIYHRDKVGISVDLDRTVYDAVASQVFDSSFQEPLEGEDNQCTYQGFVSGSLDVANGSQATSTAEYIYPWMGQSVNIMKRLSLVFTSMENGDFIDNMEETIKPVREKNESDDAYFEKVFEAVYEDGVLDLQTNLFMCADLDVIADTLENLDLSPANESSLDDLVKYISSTDCIGTSNGTDEMQDWLCANNYLEGVYCQNSLECVPLDVKPGDPDYPGTGTYMEDLDGTCGQNECTDTLASGINGIQYPSCPGNVQVAGTGMSIPSACDYTGRQEEYFTDVQNSLVSVNFMDTYFTVHEKMAPYLEQAQEIFESKYPPSIEGGKKVYKTPSYPDGYTFVSWGGYSTRGGNHGLGAAIDISGSPGTGDRTDWGNWRVSTNGRCDISLPPEFVEVMESVNLRWGGRFSSIGGGTCRSATGECFDPMHFELVPYCILGGETTPGEDTETPSTPATGNLETTFLNWMFEGAQDDYSITQNYISGVHPGLDIGVGMNTPVLAIADGTVLYYHDNGTDVGQGNGLYEPSSYGNMIVIDHGDFHAVYGHLSSVTDLEAGESVTQGQVIAYTGSSGRSTGPHLHFELRYEGCYDYLSTSCTEDPLEYLGTEGYNRRNDPSDTDYEAQCVTADGQPGYYVNNQGQPVQDILDYQKPGQTYEQRTDDELEELLLNTCSVNIPECDIGCREEIKDWVLDIADKNIAAMGSSYNTTTSYSKEEITNMMDQMYNQSIGTDTPFQWLIGIWLGENGGNPVHKNPRTDINSDIFGCGVYCEPPPADFQAELACVLRKLPGCSFLYSFDPENPGAYLQPYGPIQTNATFSTKVLLVSDALSEMQGEIPPRDLDGQCNLYVYEPGEEIWNDLSWFRGLIGYEGYQN